MKRLEHDSLGDRKVKGKKLYGIQSLRSKENYPISGINILDEVIKYYWYVKKSAAQTNMKLGKLDKKIWALIIEASEEIIKGKHHKNFVVDVFQAGAGTATHMNINEVIANRVLEMMWEKKWKYDIISPNDHVNMSQSTNDTYPTVMRLAVISKYKWLTETLNHLEYSFTKKANIFKDVIKTGRTHLQDAVPITLGQEFEAWAFVIKKLKKRLLQANTSLSSLNMWWSAIWTGINTHPDYSKTIIGFLKENTWFKKLKASKNKIADTQSQIEILEYSSALKEIAIEISRICADLKLLSSGPNTWFWEINLPAVQPGSSIMPWKVNPSIIECMKMVCYRVIWSEATVSYCVHWWQLELNTNMPLMSYELITSVNILKNWIDNLIERCIDGITANEGICRKYAYESSSLATILNPILGYSKVSELVKKQIKTKKSIIEIVLKEKILTQKELNKIIIPEKLTKPI